MFDNGSFGATTNFLVGNYPHSIVTGDFNADGKTDLAVIKVLGGASVLFGNGAGSFGGKLDFTTGLGTSPRYIATGDFNSDGRPDLVTANNGSNNVSVLLADDSGSFGPATNFTVGTSPLSVTVGDLNNDGKLDLVTADYTYKVSVLLGDGLGSFGTKTDFSLDSTPNSVVIEDFDGDGNKDLGVSNSGYVSILLGDGTGLFGTATNFSAAASVSVAAGDFNADGRSDLVVVKSFTNNVSVFLNTTDATPPTVTSVAWTPTASHTSITAGDIITVTFSEAMDKTKISANNVDARLGLSNVHTFAASSLPPANFAWNALSTTLTIKLGALSTVADGDTINPTDDITDVAGNSDNTIEPLPSITDTIAPIIISRVLTAPETILVTYSENVKTSDVSDPSNWELSGGVGETPPTIKAVSDISIVPSNTQTINIENYTGGQLELRYSIGGTTDISDTAIDSNSLADKVGSTNVSDPIVPTIVSRELISSESILVTYSEQVKTSNPSSKDNWALTGGTATIDSVQNISAGSNTQILTISGYNSGDELQLAYTTNAPAFNITDTVAIPNQLVSDVLAISVTDGIPPIFAGPTPVTAITQSGSTPSVLSNIWYYYPGQNLKFKVSTSEPLASVKACIKSITSGNPDLTCDETDFSKGLENTDYINYSTSNENVYEFNTVLSDLISLPNTPGGYPMNIQMTDMGGNTTYSTTPNQSFTAVFGINPRLLIDVLNNVMTTDWSSINDFTNVTNLVFNANDGINDIGSLTLSGPINITDPLTIAGLQNLGTNMTVSGDAIRINSDELATFNGNATLVMKMNSAIRPGLIVKNNTGDVEGYVANNASGTVEVGGKTLGGFAWDGDAKTLTFTTTGFSEFDTDNTPPVISSVNIEAGAYNVGSVVPVTITADASGYTAGAITINGQALGSFTDNNDNTYSGTYTVVSLDADRASVGVIPVSVVLVDASNNSNNAYTTAPTSSGTVTIKTTTSSTRSGSGSSSPARALVTTPISAQATAATITANTAAATAAAAVAATVATANTTAAATSSPEALAKFIDNIISNQTIVPVVPTVTKIISVMRSNTGIVTLAKAVLSSNQNLGFSTVMNSPVKDLQVYLLSVLRDSPQAKILAERLKSRPDELGYFGNRTLSLFKLWQKAVGLRTTGYFGAQERAMMNIIAN